MDITDAANIDESLPEYTIESGESILDDDQIEFMRSVGMELPIMAGTLSLDLNEVRGDERELKEAVHRMQNRVVQQFHAMIFTGNEEAVQLIISKGLVSPHTRALTGETPLLAAIATSHNTNGMVRRLLRLGAGVDEYGQRPGLHVSEEGSREPQFRTPLQYAAELGKLATVKILMEEFSADDSLIAPDGALALRLAAHNGHRDVVAYLPVRRGGAWKRWQTKHRRELRRMKKAAIAIGHFVIGVPKFCLYTVPKHLICLPLTRLLKNMWKNRRAIMVGAGRLIRELPARTQRAAVWLCKSLYRGVQKLPKLSVDILKGCWELTQYLARKSAMFIKGIPKACRLAAEWAWNGIVQLGKAIGNVISKAAALVHTTLMKLVSTITWANVLHALEALGNAIASLPSTVVRSIQALGSTLYEISKTLLGSLGTALWFIGYGTVWLVLVVPRHLWDISKSAGRLVALGAHECVVYFNPKHIGGS